MPKPTVVMSSMASLFTQLELKWSMDHLSFPQCLSNCKQLQHYKLTQHITRICHAVQLDRSSTPKLSNEEARINLKTSALQPTHTKADDQYNQESVCQDLKHKYTQPHEKSNSFCKKYAA
ncbi:hypothetical protein Droror1_Dr00016752 [Drosera rotundifolia]